MTGATRSIMTRSSKLPFPVNQDQMRMHLFLDHGEYVGDVKTMSGLVECHESSHGDHPGDHVVAHSHTIPTSDDSSPEEWSWK